MTKIQIIDGTTNRVVREVDAAQVSDAIRFASTDDGMVAIARIVELRSPTHISWRAVGADGRVLRVGTARRKSDTE